MTADKQPPSKEKLLHRTLRDFEFIARQIINFRDKPISHYRKRPEDADCTIPGQSGFGGIICGAEAQKKFDRIIDALCLIEPKLLKAISTREIESQLKKSYSDYFLTAGERFSLEVTARLTDDVITACLKCLVTQTHHFPCAMFKSEAPKSFSVGPVIFTHRSLFLKQLRSSLAHSVKAGTDEHIAFINQTIERGFAKERAYSPEQSEKLVRRYLASAIKQYRQYEWIASVKIAGFESRLSEERAARTVESAIDIIRVVIGADHTQHIRLAWNAGVPMRSAHLWTDKDNVSHPSFKTSFAEHGPQGWYELLLGRGANSLDWLGSALYILTQPERPSHIHQRLIDAIRWYGDAAVDSSPAGKVVKYVSAIERLLFGARHTDRKKKFAQRITSILSLFDCKVEDAENLAQTVYDARSGALHGALSPELEDDKAIMHRTEMVARLCILCCSQYYPRLIFNCVDTPEAFEKATQRIVEDGLDWLSEEAP